MNISELYKRKLIRYSIEVFPPKNGCSLDSLFLTIKSLDRFRPAFVSITYGAMGNARGGTVEIAARVKNNYDLEAMVHLTAVGKSRQELENFLVGARYAGIDNILALRGDPPQDRQFRKHKDGHSYAYQLVKQIKDMNEGKYLLGEGERANFSIGVACYPDGHKDNPRKDREASYLKVKQDAGADFAVTQMFFDNEKYFSFVEEARKAGVTIPIIPGIMPIKDAGSIEFFRKTFGVSTPDVLRQKMDRHSADKEAQKMIGAEHALDQCNELLKRGAPGIHFYTMNRPETVQWILSNMKSKA